MGLLLALGAATVAQAHVNRQVGPYTILVILVEEPTFEDNHAGFEFWVRRADQPRNWAEVDLAQEGRRSLQETVPTGNRPAGVTV